MRVSVFGLGYVGCVTAAGLAELGHQVIGVDIQPAKVEAVNDRHAPIAEPGLDELIASNVSAGKLRATLDPREAVRESELAMVCVGTPSCADGSMDSTYLARVVEQIANTLDDAVPFTVLVRSTCLPSELGRLLAPLTRGVRWRVGVNPEFMREGNAVSDFFHPSLILIGCDDEPTEQTARELYAALGAPIRVTSMQVAAAVKYTSNAYHAVKVTFANEIGRWCAAQGIDAHAVMNFISDDAAPETSARYLKPGSAFGGPCLGKDLLALLHQAQRDRVELPLLKAVGPGNEAHIRRALELVVSTGKRRVGMLGLAFKPGTDDVRASSLLEIAARLTQQGCELTIYDPLVVLSRLIGANRAYLETHLPQISSLLVANPAEVLERSEVIVVGHKTKVFAELAGQARADQIVVDLAGMWLPSQARAFPFEVRQLV